MDPALLKSRAAFLKGASQQPSVSTRPTEKRKEVNSEDEKQRKTTKKPKITAAAAFRRSADVKGVTPSMSVNFGILAKVVDHMRKRHLEQLTWGLALDEILEEVSLFDLASKTRQWLLEVLPQNPRMAIDHEGKFVYKPPYRLGAKNPKNGLLKILKKQDLDGKGGVLMSDLADSVANPEKIVERLGEAVIVIPTQLNKRKDKVVYYNDPESVVTIDEEFKQLWRGVAVDHLDEKKIEDYLHKHGIDSMKDLAPKNVANSAPKRKPVKRKSAALHNEHLAEGVLKDYSVTL